MNRSNVEIDEAHREELERTRVELSEARARIAAMEMSFFWRLRNAWWRFKSVLNGGAAPGEATVSPAADPTLVEVPGFAPVRFRGPAFDRSTAAVDAVVLAHDDLPALEECLFALLRHARPPYALFLADPGVAPAARVWLEGFARDQGAVLVEGADAFKKARDAGRARHVLLLDGRARVAVDVLDRLSACLSSEPDAAGPLKQPLASCGPYALAPTR